MGGYALQTSKPLDQAFKSWIKEVPGSVTLVLMSVCLVFYIVAIWISFRAYKEFKYSW